MEMILVYKIMLLSVLRTVQLRFQFVGRATDIFDFCFLYCSNFV